MAWSFDVVTKGWRAAGEGGLVILQATSPPNIALSGLQPEPLPLTTTTTHTLHALVASHALIYDLTIFLILTEVKICFKQ